MIVLRRRDLDEREDWKIARSRCCNTSIYVEYDDGIMRVCCSECGAIGAMIAVAN